VDVQQIIALLVVAAAAFLVIRHYVVRKKPNSAQCANCELAGTDVPPAPRGDGETLNHSAENGTFRRET